MEQHENKKEETMEHNEKGYLRVNQVMEYINMGRTTIWEKSKDPNDTFPEPIKLSERVTIWRKSDIDAWVDSLAKKD
jgi:prophage regulatory protein